MPNEIEDKQELVIYTSHPTDLISQIIEEFESRTGIAVKIVRGGTGELLEKIEEEKDDPKADILWGGSLSTLIPNKLLFQNYSSVNEEFVSDEFKNKEGMLTRFTDIPSILMVNEDLIGDIKIQGYEDLLRKELKGKIAFCNPNLSSSSFEHLINMLYALGDENDLGWDYVESLLINLDGNLLTSSSQVYEGVSKGEYVVGLTFEDIASSYLAKGENIKIVYMKEGVVTTPDCVAIVKDSKNLENSQRFIDFVTGLDVQSIMSRYLHRRSVRSDVKLSPYLIEKKNINQLHVNLDLINVEKEQWLLRFKEIYKKVSGNQDE